MARDGWRVFDWDYGDLDPRFARVPAVASFAAGSASVARAPALSARELLARLELPAKSLLAALLLTLLYCWPALFVCKVVVGFSSHASGLVLGAAAVVNWLACWLVAVLERRYWSRRVDTLGDFADPRPWT